MHTGAYIPDQTHPTVKHKPAVNKPFITLCSRALMIKIFALADFLYMRKHLGVSSMCSFLFALAALCFNRENPAQSLCS